jgi:hypothetical protein
MKFTEFKFGNELQEGLDMMGFEEATPYKYKQYQLYKKERI